MEQVVSAQRLLTKLKRNPERSKDVRLLYELLPGLCDEAIVAVYFRFWESLMIADVAKVLGRSWEYTDQLIENSIKDLRKGFATIQKKREQRKAA